MLGGAAKLDATLADAGVRGRVEATGVDLARLLVSPSLTGRASATVDFRGDPAGAIEIDARVTADGRNGSMPFQVELLADGPVASNGVARRPRLGRLRRAATRARRSGCRAADARTGALPPAIDGRLDGVVTTPRTGALPVEASVRASRAARFASPAAFAGWASRSRCTPPSRTSAFTPARRAAAPASSSTRLAPDLRRAWLASKWRRRARSTPSPVVRPSRRGRRVAGGRGRRRRRSQLTAQSGAARLDGARAGVARVCRGARSPRPSAHVVTGTHRRCATRRSSGSTRCVRTALTGAVTAGIASRRAARPAPRRATARRSRALRRRPWQRCASGITVRRRPGLARGTVQRRSPGVAGDGFTARATGTLRTWRKRAVRRLEVAGETSSSTRLPVPDGWTLAGASPPQLRRHRHPRASARDRGRRRSTTRDSPGRRPPAALDRAGARPLAGDVAGRGPTCPSRRRAEDRARRAGLRSPPCSSARANGATASLPDEAADVRIAWSGVRAEEWPQGGGDTRLVRSASTARSR